VPQRWAKNALLCTEIDISLKIKHQTIFHRNCVGVNGLKVAGRFVFEFSVRPLSVAFLPVRAAV
jgi:hypothetical protein